MKATDHHRIMKAIRKDYDQRLSEYRDRINELIDRNIQLENRLYKSLDIIGDLYTSGKLELSEEDRNFLYGR